MKFEIIVQLKREVLDPEGRAIQETLGRLGFRALKGVTVSKRYELELDGSGTTESEAQDVVKKIAGEYLANPVSETFEIRKL